jgi:hypothetical protein
VFLDGGDAIIAAAAACRMTNYGNRAHAYAYDDPAYVQDYALYHVYDRANAHDLVYDRHYERHDFVHGRDVHGFGCDAGYHAHDRDYDRDYDHDHDCDHVADRDYEGVHHCDHAGDRDYDRDRDCGHPDDAHARDRVNVHAHCERAHVRANAQHHCQPNARENAHVNRRAYARDDGALHYAHGRRQLECPHSELDIYE